MRLFGRRDVGKYRFGKMAVRHDERTLKMAKYTADVPDPPESYFPFNLNEVISLFPLDANERLGCCVVAGAAHYITNVHIRLGQKIVPTEKEVVDIYKKLSGCRDRGLVMLDFLKYWRKNPMFGHEIELFGSVSLHNHRLIKQCIYLFGGVDLGFLVQPDAIRDFDSGTPWTPGTNGSGGHCVIAAAYDKFYYYILTWGGVIRATKEWWDSQVDECYAILPPEYKEPGFVLGFDGERLQRDFLSITN